MITEYSLYDISMSDEEVRQNLKKVSDFNISTVSVLSNHVKIARGILNDTVKISTPIDYPLGILDSKTRISSMESAIKQGVDIINITASPYLLCNRKYDKFRDDIKINLELVQKYNVSLRYILEYRVFTYELLYKVAQILINCGIDTIYPSTGYLLDDINDNILASVLINKKVPMINIICNGNIWNIGQIQNVYKTNLYGIKVNSINALKLLQENKLKS
jgi:deoxyribose-phosphate aldolase